MQGQVAVTEMLQGSITILASPNDVSSLDVENMLQTSFSGNNLSDYLDELRMSSDPVLQRLFDISYGIPLGIPDLVANGMTGNGDRATGAEPQESEVGSMSAVWVVILICGSVGLVGMAVVGFLMHSRRSEGLRNALGIKTSNSGGTFDQGSPTSMEPQLIRRMQSIDMSDSPGGQGQEVRLEDDELPEGTHHDVVFGDMQSEITSVYSYVDRTGLNESIMTDDQSYSLAPSYLMRRSNAHGEDASQGLTSPAAEHGSSSVMWSVMDGLGDKSPCNDTNNKDSENSPSRLVISASRPNPDENDIYIFNDDDVSLVSETSEMMSSKILHVETEDGRPASPIGNESFRSSMESNIQTLPDQPSPTSEDLQKFNIDPVKVEQEETPAKRASLATVLRPKENQPLNDLSQVMETSETSRNNISRASTEGRLSAPSSAVKNRSRRSNNVDQSKEESTDDDSSLFMGPDSFAKENIPGNTKLLTLGESDKVGLSGAKNPYQIAPLFRSSARLSEKDKLQMGLRRNPSRDDSSLAESMVYPGSYAVADFRDDMSISTTGSRRRSPLSTMASF